MSVTQKDIATKLNVSINTVSRALRGMSDISEETRRLVAQTAKKLGYRKNHAASSLRTNQSRILGVVVSDFSNPVISDVIRGAEAVAKRDGFTLMIGSTNETEEDESAVVESMLAQGVDGLLLIPSMLNEALLQKIEDEQVAYVLVIRKYTNYECNVVRSDDMAGAVVLARHLCELGHRRFLYVSGPEYLTTSSERYAGFLAGMQEYGLTQDQIETIVSGGNREDAYRAMQEWLAQTKETEEQPTAIFAYSDYVACGVYKALREHQIRIPEDMSVVGFDNNSFSDILVPMLTTMDIRFYDIGRRAMERLLELLRQESIEPKDYVSLPELVRRESTAAPRKKA